jgi:hypothetical protein
MLLLWLAAGVFYYQLLRYPAHTVRVVTWLRGRELPEPPERAAPSATET